MLQCWESMARTGGCTGGSFKSANQKAVGTARSKSGSANGTERAGRRAGKKCAGGKAKQHEWEQERGRPQGKLMRATGGSTPM